MDDNRFDDIIKEKIGEYEHPDYDPAALAGLHYRMSSQFKYPWYVRYRNEMITVAAALVLGLLILWGQKEISNANINTLKEQLVQLQKQNEELIAHSKKEGQNTETRSIAAPDTVRIVEYVNNDMLYQSLRKEISSLQNQLSKLDQNNAGSPKVGEQLVYVGRRSELPDGSVHALSKKHSLIDEEGYLFLMVENDGFQSNNYPYLVQRKNLKNRYVIPEYEFIIDSLSTSFDDGFLATVKKKPVQISIKQMREMEKRNYKKGIGIELGPVLEVNRGRYSPGSGSTGFGIGVMANFITSPNLGVEAGLLFNANEYAISADEINQLSLPEPDPIYGKFENAEISHFFFEIPVNLKYRYRISPTKHIIGAAGLSAMFFTKEEVEYIYFYEIDENFISPLETSYRNKETHGYLGTANISLGLSSLLNNGKKLETSLFYKRNLQSLGIEGVDIDYVGVKASYQFKIK